MTENLTCLFNISCHKEHLPCSIENMWREQQKVFVKNHVFQSNIQKYFKHEMCNRMELFFDIFDDILNANNLWSNKFCRTFDFCTLQFCPIIFLLNLVGHLKFFGIIMKLLQRQKNWQASYKRLKNCSKTLLKNYLLSALSLIGHDILTSNPLHDNLCV